MTDSIFKPTKKELFYSYYQRQIDWKLLLSLFLRSETGTYDVSDDASISGHFKSDFFSCSTRTMTTWKKKTCRVKEHTLSHSFIPNYSSSLQKREWIRDGNRVWIGPIYINYIHYEQDTRTLEEQLKVFLQSLYDNTQDLW